MLYLFIKYHELMDSLGRTQVDGSKILSVSRNDKGKLWSNTGELLSEIEGNGFANAIFSPDGKRIITVSGRLVKMWDDHGQWIKDLKGHGCHPTIAGHCGINHIAFSPDGKHFVSVSSGAEIMIWDKNGNLVKKIPKAHKGGFIIRVRFSPDNKHFVMASFGNGPIANVWNIKGKLLATIDKGECPKQPTSDCNFSDAAFIQDGEKVVSISLYLPIRHPLNDSLEFCSCI